MVPCIASPLLQVAQLLIVLSSYIVCMIQSLKTLSNRCGTEPEIAAYAKAA